MEILLLLSSIVSWIVILVNLILTFALIRKVNGGNRSDSSVPSTGLEVGTEAPDFTAQTLEGETVTRAAYAGRSVAFVFISTNCQPCREALPEIEQLGPEAARAGVEIVLVSRDAQEATSAFLNEMQIHLPVLIFRSLRATRNRLISNESSL